MLAFIAGIVNVVGLLGFQHEAITHLTGNASLLARSMVHGDWPMLGHLAALMGSFVGGAVLSGFVIQDSALQLGHRYGAALLMVSLLLFASVPLLQAGNALGMHAAACACGIQNAMASTYSGTVIRTTHVSGMFTDLGIFLGHALRRLPVDGPRARLCLIVISGFACGGLAGTLLFDRWGYRALLLPAGITMLVAATYTIRRARRQYTAGGFGSGGSYDD